MRRRLLFLVLPLVATAAACDVKTADEPVKWGFTPVFLPNTCTLVTKLDADGIVRTRYEDGRQSPCDPETFEDK